MGVTPALIMESRRHFFRPFHAVLLLVAAAAAAYATSLKGVFVYDDIVSILENASLRSLFWEAWFPPPGITTSGRPVANVTFALNHLWGGVEPFGYHVVNWMIHCGAGLALFGLVRRTLLLPVHGGRFEGEATGLALCVALLWVVHPLQTEAVT